MKMFAKRIEKGANKLKTAALSCLVAGTMLTQAPVANATDVVILIDTTGSTGALLPNWQARLQAEVIDVFKAVDPNTRFGLASHLDFPFSPFGGSTEYAYRLETPLDSNVNPLITALGELNSGWGGDTKESQLEALYQAATGNGRDLNGNGSFSDPGDILPSNMGFNSATPSIFIHFTSPLVFHNDPVEPNYPYAGVVNSPADLPEAVNAMVSKGMIYYVFEPNALPLSIAPLNDIEVFDEQSKMPLLESIDTAKVSASSDPARAIADATGGDIISVGSDLSGLKDAVTRIADETRICKKGTVPVVTPVGVFCIPDRRG